MPGGFQPGISFQASGIAVGVLALLLAGCTIPATSHAAVEAEGNSALPDACRRFFAALDRAVDAARVRDAQAARIAGFPYLRADRFWAAYPVDPADDVVFTAWVARLRALDRAAREAEIANLPAPTRQALRRNAPVPGDLHASVRHCGMHLSEATLRDAAARRQLHASTAVPDAYHTIKRILGVYPLSALPVRAAVTGWHHRMERAFAHTPDQAPPAGIYLRYSPLIREEALSPAQTAALLRHSARNPLGVPEPDTSEQARLFATFAPLLEIAGVGYNDRIGSPYWPDSGDPRLDISRPTMYTHISHTWFGGQPLLQLNYVAWFPSRPLRGALDILGGRLDGLYWRVTLDSDGIALLYDSMHPCGCYHMLFPTARLRARPAGGLYTEPPLIPQEAPETTDGRRLVLRVTSGAHQLQRLLISVAPAPAIHYRLRGYPRLRSLPAPGGVRRSLFEEDGIVPGTARRERWILWPMGVPSPGAMRQWGLHANAFIGRRHFDDPHLLDRLFERRDER